MSRHDGHTYRTRSRRRRAWLNTRGLIPRAQKSGPLKVVRDGR